MRYWILAILALAACKTKTFGEGLGRPPGDNVARPVLLPLRVSEVYSADVPANQFVEIIASGAVSASTIQICSADATCVTETLAAAGAGSRQSFDASTLGLTASAGELAILAPDGFVTAYAAWGADPAWFGSSLLAGALWSGAAQAGEYVPLPFPMTDGVAVGFENTASGCATPSRDAAATIDNGLCPETPVPVQFTELLPDDGSDSWVELTSLVNAPLSLYGARLCQMPHCALLDRSFTLAALGKLVVHLGAAAPAVAGHVAIETAPRLAASGELVLLAPGPAAVDATNPDGLAAYLSFTRYGGATGMLSDVAVAAGKWSQSLDAAAAPRIAGESLSWDPGGPAAGAAWNPTYPTPLLDNLDLSAADDTWTSCSFPKPSRRAGPPAAVVNGLTRPQDGAANIQIKRRTATFDTLVTLALGTASFSSAAIGTSSSPADEAMARQPNGADTGSDATDWAHATATLGTGNGGQVACNGVIINEVVTQAQLDWSDSAGGGTPFDATPGTGTVDAGDEWVELYNCGSTVDLSAYMVHFNDGIPSTLDLGVALNGQSLVFSAGSTLNAFASGGFLVIGAPAGTGNELENQLNIQLETGDRTIDQVVLGGWLLTATVNIELDPELDGCPIGRLCWQSPLAVLPQEGELTLFKYDGGLGSDVMQQYFVWGNASRLNLSAAEQAGAWPRIVDPTARTPYSECASPAFNAGCATKPTDCSTNWVCDEAVDLVTGSNGQSPADYEESCTCRCE